MIGLIRFQIESTYTNALQKPPTLLSDKITHGEIGWKTRKVLDKNPTLCPDICRGSSHEFYTFILQNIFF